MSETLVTTIDGNQVKLTSDGTFFTNLETGPVRDKSLDGLKKKLANIKRASTRAQAVELPAVALVWGGRWGDDTESPDHWFTGTFAGVNAHTGDVTFLVGKEKMELTEYAVFFRAGDPAIETVKGLLKARRTAERQAALTKKAYEEAIERYGHHVRVGYGRHGADKAEQAGAAEQRLIDFLAGKVTK